MSEKAKKKIEIGNKYPYDMSSRGTAPEASDWAVIAARGVLADLSDRRGIKWALDDIDLPIRRKIVADLADIIRTAHAAGPEKEPHE